MRLKSELVKTFPAITGNSLEITDLMEFEAFLGAV